MSWLRRGGSGDGQAGDQVIWSVAEGTRGARWREAATRDGVVRRSVLFEVAPDGRATRLELATAAGLLTLHPEPDGATLHGNVVTPGGIRHLAFVWSADHALLVDGSPVAFTVLIRPLTARGIARGERVVGEGLRIDDALLPSPVSWTVERPAPEVWSIHAGDETVEVRLDASGLPVLDEGRAWPLEAS